MIEAGDTDHLRETLLERRDIYTGRLLHVYEDEVSLPSGRRGRREIVAHRGAVCIAATTDVGGVVLVRQWRHAAGRALWELPAGTIDPGEDPRACAERELAEETGYRATEWRELARAHVSPGYSTEVIVFYGATGLTPGTPDPDEDEILDVAEFNRGEISALTATGDIDMKTVAGLALVGVGLA